MFGPGIRLFKIFGFEVRIDSSWFLLAILIILMLSTGYFPFHYRNLSAGAYIVMGIVGAIGLFASIILHELSHSLVARRVGIQMEGISLFIFGGVAKMGSEAKNPKSEFLMAIAGPIASLILAGVFYILFLGLLNVGTPDPIAGVVRYLAWINVILAIFNMLPAFPLDGGRVLRSILWGWKGNLIWATRIASGIGAGFGLALIILGILSLLAGALIAGLWWCLIGMFLRGISHGSYRQTVIRETLAGEPVRRFMREEPVTISANTPIEDLVQDYIYRYHFKMFPVLEQDRLKGCVTTREVREVPQKEWKARKVSDIAIACSESNTIGPDADATDALAAMNRSGNSRLLVVENNRLLGIVALKDMLRFLAVKLDLEGSEADAQALGRELGPR